MLKKFGMAALALIMSLGAVSMSEAAQANDSQNELCCRGSYCYNQNYNRSGRDGRDCGEYCCDGERGCW